MAALAQRKPTLNPGQPDVVARKPSPQTGRPRGAPLHRVYFV